MKEKRVLASFLILAVISAILFSVIIISAQDDAEVAKSYECLKKQLGTNCGETSNTIQAAFNLIAMAYDSSVQSGCRTSLSNKEKTNCWPDTTSSSTCTLKSSAIATLALEYVNSDVDDNIAWLKSKRKLATDLTWYLEIDAINATQCSVNGQSFNIGENKKISGADPIGLSKAYSNYWFQINDLNKNYTISCNSSFVTTLLYKKPGSGIYYVSSETHSAAASDSTTESVNGFCFTTSAACDYEGTLWATLAMLRNGEDITPYVPYITAMSDDTANSKYLPYAFMFMLDNGATDYLSGFLNLQKQGKYWEVSGNKLYDTSVALLALQGGSDQQAISARAYLLTQRITSGDKSGCWASDTSFILYSGWPKSPASTSPGPANRNCEDFNYSCTSRGDCSLANTLTNFDCTSLSQVCCSVKPAILNCEQKEGMICKSGEECTGSVVSASDTSSCCISGACEEISTTNECTDNGGLCKEKCSSSEEERGLFASSCDVTEVCCTAKENTGLNWWLIILLIILIILVILAIIFRNQLKIWWFKMKSGMKSKKGPEPTSRPPTPPPFAQRPTLMSRQIIPRQAPSRPQARPAPGRASPAKAQKDKEFEDTMKKLRDMSK